MEIHTLLALIAGIALGLLVGLAAGLVLAARAGLSDDALARRERRVVELADSRFREAGARTSGDLALREQAVEHMVAPVRSALERVETRLVQVETARAAAQAALGEQVRSVAYASEQLRAETASLAGALRSPNARGRWGEVQLRRVVELAGMLKHCDFYEQVTLDTGDARQRPDLVVRLAGGRGVVIDAKVPLSAYLEAAGSGGDGVVREERLVAHARALRSHVDTLAAKDYWAAVQPGPEIVVLFVPAEAFLAPALDADPTLLEHAMGKGVVIATPTVLLTLLRTIAFGWQQDSLAEGARDVVAAGRDLHRRLGTLAGHVDKLGRSLSRSVDDYNTAVGSFERSVVPATRRLSELGVGDAVASQGVSAEGVGSGGRRGGGTQLHPAPVDNATRPMTVRLASALEPVDSIPASQDGAPLRAAEG